MIAGEYMYVGRCRGVTARGLRTPCGVEGVSRLRTAISAVGLLPQSALCYDNERWEQPQDPSDDPAETATVRRAQEQLIAHANYVGLAV